MRDADGYYEIEGEGKLPSVTTILHSIGKGMGLNKWYEKNGTHKVFIVLNKLKELAPFIHDTILKDLPEDFMQSGSDKLQESGSIGSSCHMYFDNWMKGIRWTIDDVPDRLRGPCAAFLDTVGKEDFEVIKSEATVYSSKYRYAGTLDAVVKIGNKIILRDWKTSSRIYQEHFLQAVAYLYACRELTGEKIDGIEIYRFGKDGTFESREVDPSQFDYLFQVFLHVYEVWKWGNNGRQ